MAPRMKIETQESAPSSTEPKQAASEPTPATSPKKAQVRAPKAKVAPAPATPQESATRPAPHAAKPRSATTDKGFSAAPKTEPQADASQDQPAATGPLQAVPNWVRRTFPGHENAFWGGVIAFALAILIFVIGPLRALFICLVVAVGVAIGQVLDGDPKIIRTIRSLFDDERNR